MAVTEEQHHTVRIIRQVCFMISLVSSLSMLSFLVFFLRDKLRREAVFRYLLLLLLAAVIISFNSVYTFNPDLLRDGGSLCVWQGFMLTFSEDLSEFSTL